jgi:hypothetical protein
VSQRQRQLDHVSRAAAGQHLDRLGDLDGVAGRQAQRRGHVGEQSDGVHPGVGAEGDHGLGQLAGGLERLHEGARADLDVEHQCAGALGDLLGHDRRRDQRDRLDRAGHVAQGVELLVCGREPVTCRADHCPDGLELGEHLLVGEQRPPPGDRLELVERAAGVAQAPPRQLGYGDPARRDERRERQRDLVTDTPGGVLVGRGARQSRKIHPLPGRDHRAGPAADLAAVHPVEQDRHRQGRHLLVGHLAARVGVDHPVDLAVAELTSITLGDDHLDGVVLAGGHEC